MKEIKNKIPVNSEVEQHLKKHGFKKIVWNNTINEWSKNLNNSPGKLATFKLCVRFNEWIDIKGGMVYLYTGHSYTALTHVKTLEQILNIVEVLTIKEKTRKKLPIQKKNSINL